MPDDRFEDRLRAIAQQLSRSISEVDLDEVADRLGVDPDRVRGAAGAVEDWLNDRGSTSEPLFSTGPGQPHEYVQSTEPVRSDAPAPARTDGPHPLDLPTDHQGRALSALASGRWTVRPGSGRLSNAEPPVGAPAPGDVDLAGELRARDWISADGAVTLVGEQALLRWCRNADAVTPARPTRPTPPTPPTRANAATPDPPAEAGDVTPDLPAEPES
jgi:hypothetical protein